MKPSYHLAAMGMVNALGTEKATILHRLLAGDTSSMKPSNQYIPHKTTPVGKVEERLPDIPDRLAQYRCRNNALLLLALQQIEGEVNAAIAQYGAERIGVVMGSSTTGIAAGEAAIAHKEATGAFPKTYHYIQQELGATAHFVADYFQTKGIAYTVSTACSSSAKVFASGRNLLRMGACDAVILGGADSLCQMTLQGFSSLGALSEEHCNPMSANRSGINIGEAATVFLLKTTTETTGIQLLGVGETSDAFHISAPDPTGTGAYNAMQQALQDAQFDVTDVAYINLHGTATQHNDAMESKAIAKLFGTQIPCSSTKPLIGHTLGAAGATEVGFCWLLLQDPTLFFALPPHIWDEQRDEQLPLLSLVQPQEHNRKEHSWRACLSNSFAFGGNNCSVLIGSLAEETSQTSIIQERKGRKNG